MKDALKPAVPPWVRALSTALALALIPVAAHINDAWGDARRAVIVVEAVKAGAARQPGTTPDLPAPQEGPTPEPDPEPVAATGPHDPPGDTPADDGQPSPRGVYDLPTAPARSLAGPRLLAPYACPLHVSQINACAGTSAASGAIAAFINQRQRNGLRSCCEALNDAQQRFGVADCHVVTATLRADLNCID